MNAQIGDVARAAGVSTATVSRALRGLPNVSPETRDRVRQVANGLGYVVSRSASRLATGRTQAVAVVAPHLDRWFFGQAVAAIESELRLRDMDALLVGMSPPGDLDRTPFLADSLRGRVDAVAVLTVPLTGRELDDLRRLDLPTVFVGAAVAGAMSVRIDDMLVATLATEHLLSLGHRRIAYVGGDPTQPLNFTTPADRRAGWLSAMRRAGIEPEAAWDVPGDFTATGGAAALRQFLLLRERPTAVFAASDEMAMGVLLEARKHGLRVPEDLSVIGVDGHELATVMGLTTVEQPVGEQGAMAARLLLAALHGEVVHGQEHAVVPVRLAVRDSTAAPCDADHVVTQT